MQGETRWLATRFLSFYLESVPIDGSCIGNSERIWSVAGMLEAFILSFLYFFFFFTNVPVVSLPVDRKTSIELYSFAAQVELGDYCEAYDVYPDFFEFEPRVREGGVNDHGHSYFASQ